LKSLKLRQTYKNFSGKINEENSKNQDIEESKKTTIDEEFDWADDQI